MPELPEVHTTVLGLNKKLKNLTITDVWSSYNSPSHKGKSNIKNLEYFKDFKKAVTGGTFVKAERRGKNILIELSNGHTVLIHMKMTGHLLYGNYSFNKKGSKWTTTDRGPLEDPFNQHIRLVFSLSNGKHLAFSDLRKFAKVFAIPTKEIPELPDLLDIGPEPLEKSFTFEKFRERLSLRPNWPIKQTLLDQSVIAGIGNIYSDEMLWSSRIHPFSKTSRIPQDFLKDLYKQMKIVLEKGINFGGDSDSDYRNIDGKIGEFQNKHHTYRHTGEVCARPRCGGIIERKKLGSRSAHFCPKHQKLFK